ncbi:DNA phosphorothioation-dependent restriction protein DptG [Vibrio ruber]|uniref:DNA phosphorothioation-dependent restriction protein DptG n=1 Tax=Vibrio ruber TaxID=184755 RepID=UPI002892E88C|nr:DNA phosphorothioation-dependent restriction protein DptG [Vibrio ruber]WNJ95915.1 DNA phosphorothioation-dependent restriction protein DptG [Vibrio ruber]
MTIDKNNLPVNSELPQTVDDKVGTTSLKSYFPIRTSKKGNDFDWSTVVGLFLRKLMRKDIGSYTLNDYLEDCRALFLEKLSEKQFWNVIEEMYFSNDSIYSISPELLVFKSQQDMLKIRDEDVANLFLSLANGLEINKFSKKCNFIEAQMVDVLDKKLKDDSKPMKVIEHTYLPFLSASFCKDIKFLCSKPVYFLTEIENFLRLYAFTYSAQLSISISEWSTCKEPTAKPLYFILEHEKASKERIHIQKHGYQLYSYGALNLYPILNMLETLQPSKDEKIPLWKLAKCVKESTNDFLKVYLKNFALRFKSDRDLQNNTTADSAFDWLEYIFDLAKDQFNDYRTDRPAIRRKYVDEIEKHFASHFIQNRGRSGKILVLNQDYIILLTNLAIGEAADKLRFHELIAEFKQRGIFVDKQTEQELIKFYERIGNVERMSDSGDAVYVRKTI